MAIRRTPLKKTIGAWRLILLACLGIATLAAALGLLSRAMSERSAREQVWRIGYHQTEPFIFRGSHGEPVGFAKDVMDEAARRAGIRLKWVYVPQGAGAAFRDDLIDLFPRSTDVPDLARAPYISRP